MKLWPVIENTSKEDPETSSRPISHPEEGSALPKPFLGALKYLCKLESEGPPVSELIQPDVSCTITRWAEPAMWSERI